MKTKVLTPEEYAEAAEIIIKSGLVAIPTDTVYGLAADPTLPEAIDSIYTAKGRPDEKPIIILVSSAEDAEKFAYINDRARNIMSRFWPGAVTIIQKKKPCVSDRITAGGDTVGLRCPADETARAVISAAGGGVAAPSANISGERSPKNVTQVLEGLDGRIDAVVDGGECRLGVVSTIVDLTEDDAKILRIGAVPEAEILALVCEIQ